jgi:hypothetical protein
MAKLYHMLSPDGITITERIGYKSTDEVEKAFQEWEKNFEKQGYYSSTSGRIDLDYLYDACEIITVDVSVEDLLGVVEVWIDDTRIIEKYCVSGQEGPIAWFVKEIDANRFRLDYINRLLNP